MGRTKGSTKLARLTSVRTGLKENLKGIMDRLKAEMAKESPSEVRLSVESKSLVEKETKLRMLNDEIQVLTDEGQLAAEVTREENYLDQLMEVRVTAAEIMEQRVSMTRATEACDRQPERPDSCQPGPSGHRPPERPTSRAIERSAIEALSRNDVRPFSRRSSLAAPAFDDREGTRADFEPEAPFLTRVNSRYHLNDTPRSHIRKPTIELKKFDGKNWSDWPDFGWILRGNR